MANLKPAHPTLRTWLARAMEAARSNRTLARSAAGALGALTPLAVLANPTGGTVVAGSATITNPNANHTVIDQNSQRAIINWQQFSVGSNQFVQFIQPNSSSVVLNRVVGGNASAIFGNITANGQVFLVNTNGIYFARGATLDAQGFVGSTLDIRNNDFMMGRMNFVKGSGAPDASVVNDGAITADRKGYVVLAGDYVQNNGSINAMSGQVVLAAGNSAQLTLDRNQLISYVVNGATLARLAGVDNTGQIVADGGAVIMTADVANALTATAVNNSGFVAARSLLNDRGTIVLAAQGGDIENSGTLDASAAARRAQGGTVIIHGNGHTQLDVTSVIDTAGNGSAKGGFIELSGHTLGVRGSVVAGKGGNLLIDPSVIHIVAGAGNNSVSVGTGSIGTGFIDTKLNAGSNVAIVASHSIANAGGTGITATGTGNLTIAIGTVSIGPSCGFGGICHGTGSFSISRFTGNVDLSGLPIDIKGKLDVSATGGSGGSIIMAGAKAGSITLEAPKVTVNGNLTANTGSISVGGGRGSAGFAGLNVTGNIQAAGAFKVSFSNEGGATVGTITTGNITAKSIFINAATISVGSLDATGSAATGDITLKAAKGSVDVAGAITAGGALLISASASSNGGNVDISGAAVAKSITINATGNGGGNVTTKGLHANGAGTGDGVSINAIDSASAFSSGQVNVTGSIISDNGSIGIHTQGGGDSGGAKINVTGGINAARGVSITADYIGSSTFGAPSVDVGGNITGKSIDVNVTGPNATVTLGGNLKATGASGGVSVNLNSGGKLSIGGKVTGKAGVGLNVSGSGSHAGSVVVGGSISGGSVRVYATGIQSNGGKVTINGNVVATGTQSNEQVSISAYNNSNGNGQVTVNGNITSDFGVNLNATGNVATIAVNGNIHANTHGCAISDCNAGGVNLYAPGGNVTMNGNITVDKDNFRTTRVSLYGQNVSFGNITANGGDVAISAANFTGSGGLIKQAAGTTLKARDINVGLHASYGGSIKLANLVASSSNAPALIQVSADVPHGASAIVVNGNITVSGKARVGFSSAMPGSFGTPFAAHLGLQATAGSGSGGNAHTVKVNGNINVTGHLGNVNDTHGSCSGECGPTNTLHVHGTGGVADVFLWGSGTLGSAVVNGGMNVKGPDAHVDVRAHVIKVGAITATGTGHNLTRTFTSALSSSRDATSNNNGGFAFVNLGENFSPAVTVTAGNITVSGKGMAQVGVHAQHITVGNIAVTATAAHGTMSGAGFSGSGFGSFGLYGVPMHSGSITAGFANVDLDNGFGSAHSRPAPSQTISAGNISVTGVGGAQIELAASSMQAKNLSAVATAGTMRGTGTSSSGEGTNVRRHTFNIKGGEAHVHLEGSGSNGGIIKVAGNISAKGPSAGVDIRGQTINVSGGVQAMASGASITSDVVVTGQSNYHTHFVGPGKVTGVGITGSSGSASSIKVGGTVSVTGKGLVGVNVQGNHVTLGGLNASASAAAKYSVLDTRVSTTTQTFTLGSVVAIVSQESGGAISGPVTITGNATLTAKAGNVFLPVNWKVGGTLKVTASGNVTADISGIAPRFDQIGGAFGDNGSGGSRSGSSPAVSTAVDVVANSAAVVAGGSIDLTGAAMTVTKELQLIANKNIILSGVNLNVGILSAVASGTIHNGGGPGTITAGGLLVEAGKDVNLSSTAISVKAGHVPGVNSDGVLNAALGALGIAPTSTAPNATFIAGGNLTLGTLSMTGTYLNLQAKSVTLLGPVTLPANSLVQVAPILPTSTIGIENQPSTGSDFNLSNSLFLSLFSGDTVVVGNFQESGAVNIGQNGAFTLSGGTNLLIYSTGTVTGLDNVTSTGIVAQLVTQAATPPPTAGEIDPNSGGTGTTVTIKKKNGETIDVNADTGDKGGTVSQDTGTTSVCH